MGVLLELICDTCGRLMGAVFIANCETPPAHKARCAMCYAYWQAQAKAWNECSRENSWVN
jgi:hypothetical protein